jgi:hypothetical protein
MADQSVVRAFRKAIRVKRASPREAKALFEAGITESGLRNLNYGDRDSLGSLQERQSIYGRGHALNPYQSALRFLTQAQQVNRKGFHGSAGQLAQSAQRSAFPGRYDTHSAEAERFLAGLQANSAAGSVPSTTTTTRTTSLTPDALQGRRTLLAQFVLDNKADPVALAQNFAALNQTQTTTKVRTSGQPSSGPPEPSGAAGNFKSIFEKAAAINAKHLPYRWGGGHGPTPAKPGVPLDCSGAVSAVLGVTPRVSGQFEKYGKAGRGKHVTIYANGHHVLLEINGHYWGTSASNPGGGAGWIPRAQISPQYLSGFVARHPPGL